MVVGGVVVVAAAATTFDVTVSDTIAGSHLSVGVAASDSTGWVDDVVVVAAAMGTQT